MSNLGCYMLPWTGYECTVNIILVTIYWQESFIMQYPSSCTSSIIEVLLSAFSEPELYFLLEEQLFYRYFYLSMTDYKSVTRLYSVTFLCSSCLMKKKGTCSENTKLIVNDTIMHITIPYSRWFEYLDKNGVSILKKCQQNNGIQKKENELMCRYCDVIQQ